MGHTSSIIGRLRMLCRSFSRDESAQDLVEYVLLAAIMSACMLLAWDYILSSSVSTVYYVIVQQIEKIFWGVAW